MDNTEATPQSESAVEAIFILLDENGGSIYQTRTRVLWVATRVPRIWFR